MQNEFVHLHRVIISLFQLDLPGPNTGQIVKDMLELIKVDKRSLDLVELHFADLRAP